MAAQTPTTADALRRYARAVVLVASRGHGSRPFQDAVRESGAAANFIGHPLLAMADLCRFDRETVERGVGERIGLFVVDRDIEDLEPLFAAVQSRLPRVSIWVIQSDIAIPVRISDVEPVADADRTSRRHAPGSTPGSTPVSMPGGGGPPKLRFVEGADGSVAAAKDGDGMKAAPNATSTGESVTHAELDMLLGLFDDERNARSSPDRGGPR